MFSVCKVRPARQKWKIVKQTNNLLHNFCNYCQPKRKMEWKAQESKRFSFQSCDILGTVNVATNYMGTASFSLKQVVLFHVTTITIFEI